MSRKKVEINPIRGERLKMLLIENGVDQKELASKIGYTKEHISYIINGRRNLTEDAAQAIIKQFPGTRIEWLMGFSDYKNNTEKVCNTISHAQKEGDLLLRGLSAFAHLAGYQIKLPLPASMEGIIFAEDALKAIKEGYTISRGDESIQMSLEEMNTFENEISDFVELYLKHLFRRKGAKNNG